MLCSSIYRAGHKLLVRFLAFHCSLDSSRMSGLSPVSGCSSIFVVGEVLVRQEAHVGCLVCCCRIVRTGRPPHFQSETANKKCTVPCGITHTLILGHRVRVPARAQLYGAKASTWDKWNVRTVRKKRNSDTGNRTRAFPVRAENPNH